MSDKALKRAAFAVLISVAAHVAVLSVFTAGMRMRPERIRTVRLNVSELEFSAAGETGARVADTGASVPSKSAIAPIVPAAALPPETKWSAAPSPASARPAVDVSPPDEKPRFEIPEAGEASAERAGVRVDAKMSGSIVPVYPRASRMRGEEGVVRLEALVDTSGRVVKVQVRVSSGYPRLDEAAAAALETARFEPAMSDGSPIESKVLLPFVFRLD